MRSRQINFAEGDGGETTLILAGIIEQLALGCLDYKKERLCLASIILSGREF
jgi:hypothetical protein